jgi:dihydroorotase
LKKKGRISVGAHADIVIFDYELVKDEATVEKPERMSIGMQYVLVNGTVVKDPRGINKSIRPGKPLRGDGIPGPVHRKEQ